MKGLAVIKQSDKKKVIALIRKLIKKAQITEPNPDDESSIDSDYKPKNSSSENTSQSAASRSSESSISSDSSYSSESSETSESSESLDQTFPKQLFLDSQAQNLLDLAYNKHTHPVSQLKAPVPVPE